MPSWPCARLRRACLKDTTLFRSWTLTSTCISMVSRNNRYRLVTVLCGLVVAPPALRAQAPQAGQPLKLSFGDAVRLAAGEAPAVALATLRTDEADARVRQARAALLPSLSLGGLWVNRDFNSEALGIPFPPQFNLANPVPAFNNYDGRVTVTQ